MRYENSAHPNIHSQLNGIANDIIGTWGPKSIMDPAKEDSPFNLPRINDQRLPLLQLVSSSESGGLSPNMQAALRSLPELGPKEANLARRIEALDPSLHSRFGIEQQLSNGIPDFEALDTAVADAETRNRFEQTRDSYNRYRDLFRLNEAGEISAEQHQEFVALRRRLFTSKNSEIDRKLWELRTRQPRLNSDGSIGEIARSGGDRTQQAAWDAMRVLLENKLIGPGVPSALKEKSLRELGYEIIPIRANSLIDGMGGDFVLVNRKNGDYWLIDPKQMRRSDNGTLRDSGIIDLPRDLSDGRIYGSVKDKVIELVVRMETKGSPLNLFRTQVPLDWPEGDRHFAENMSDAVDHTSAAQTMRKWLSHVEHRQAQLRQFIDDVRTSVQHANKDDQPGLREFAGHFESRGGQMRWLRNLHNNLSLVSMTLTAFSRNQSPLNKRMLLESVNELREHFGREGGSAGTKAIQKHLEAFVQEISRAVVSEPPRRPPTRDALRNLGAYVQELQETISRAAVSEPPRRPPPRDALRPESAPGARGADGIKVAPSADGTIRLEEHIIGESMTPESLRRQNELSTEQIRALERELNRLEGIETEREQARHLEQVLRRLRGELGPEARTQAHRGILEATRKRLEERLGARGALGSVVGFSMLVGAALGWYGSSQSPLSPSPLIRPTVTGDR